MNGRATSVAVSSSTVQIVGKNVRRTRLYLSCGNAGGNASVILKDHLDATATNGFPLTGAGGWLVLEGRIAQHEWNAIRLAAADCVVGVIEGFDDGLSEEGQEEMPPVPTVLDK